MKQCEVCGKSLTGKQTRFCSRHCRNVVAGRASAARFQPPDKGWLSAEYLMPPEGKGRTLPDLSQELGVSEVTLRKWLDQYGIRQDARQRLSWQGSRPKPWRRKGSPPIEELARFYLSPPNGDGKTEDQLAEIYSVSRPTVRRWLNELGLMQSHSERHTVRMAGENNPAYTNGNSQKYVKRQLLAIKDAVCDWCGTTERVEIHHIDHNRENNDLSNLTWLCGHCNKLEAHLWHLVRLGSATYEVTQNQRNVRLTITFARR